MGECTGQYSLVTWDRKRPPLEPNGTFVSEHQPAGSTRLELDVHLRDPCSLLSVFHVLALFSPGGVPPHFSRRPACLSCCVSFLWLLSQWPLCGCKTIGIYSLTGLEAKTSTSVPLGGSRHAGRTMLPPQAPGESLSFLVSSSFSRQPAALACGCVTLPSLSSEYVTSPPPPP